MYFLELAFSSPLQNLIMSSIQSRDVGFRNIGDLSVSHKNNLTIIFDQIIQENNNIPTNLYNRINYAGELFVRRDTTDITKFKRDMNQAICSPQDIEVLLTGFLAMFEIKEIKLSSPEIFEKFGEEKLKWRDMIKTSCIISSNDVIYLQWQLPQVSKTNELKWLKFLVRAQIYSSWWSSKTKWFQAHLECYTFNFPSIGFLESAIKEAKFSAKLKKT